jgi:excisionase family DNA binding protein
MADRVIVPLPGIGALALSLEAYQAALAEGAKLIAAPTTSSAFTAPEDEALLDAGELARVLRLPKSCVYEKARTGEFPSVRVGKHVRFQRSHVLSAIASTAPEARGHS